MGHLFSSSEETRYYWLEHQNEDFGAYIWRDAIRRSSKARSRLTFLEMWLAEGSCMKRAFLYILASKTSSYRCIPVTTVSFYQFWPVLFLLWAFLFKNPHLKIFHWKLKRCLFGWLYTFKRNFSIMEFFSDFLTNVLEFPLKFWKESRNQDILSPWVLWLWYFGPDQPKISEKEVKCHLFLL